MRVDERTGFVKANMTVGANTQELKIQTPGSVNLRFVRTTKIGHFVVAQGAIGNVVVFDRNVNMVE